MPAKSRTLPSTALLAFWDTSAIVPLCCRQPQTSEARRAARLYGRQVVDVNQANDAIASGVHCFRTSAMH